MGPRVELEYIVHVACAISLLEIVVRGGVGPASIDDELKLLSDFYVEGDSIQVASPLQLKRG